MDDAIDRFPNRRGARVTDGGAPTRDADDSGSATASPDDVCTWCGATIETSAWYPIVTERGDETIRLLPFCSEDCKESWNDHQPE